MVVIHHVSAILDLIIIDFLLEFLFSLFFFFAFALTRSLKAYKKKKRERSEVSVATGEARGGGVCGEVQNPFQKLKSVAEYDGNRQKGPLEVARQEGCYIFRGHQKETKKEKGGWL